MDNEDKVKENEVSESTPVEANGAESLRAVNEELMEQNKKKSHTVIGLAILSAMLLFGSIGFFAFNGSSDTKEAASSESEIANDTAENADQVAELKQSDNLHSVIYAHADDDSSPRGIFSRPVAGGDRKELGTTTDNGYIVHTSDGNNYVFTNAERTELWHAEGEDAPTLIYTTEATERLHSLILNTEHSRALFNVVDGDYNASIDVTNSKILSVTTDGQDIKEEFTSTDSDLAVVFLSAWDPVSGQIAFRSSCIQCDGSNSDLKLINNGTISDLFDAGGYEHEAKNVSLSDDMTKVLYVKVTKYTNQQLEDYDIQQGLGGPGLPPLQLVVRDIASGNEEVLATYGDIEDARGNYGVTHTAGWADSDTAFYSYDNKLFVQNGTGSFDNVFETGQGSITRVFAASSEEVLIESNPGTGDELIISHFDVTGGKATTVMSATYNTQILTVIRGE